jgi:hypothetical protein
VKGRGALLGPEESGLEPLGSWIGFSGSLLHLAVGSLRILGVGVGVWLGPAFTKPLVMVF